MMFTLWIAQNNSKLRNYHQDTQLLKTYRVLIRIQNAITDFLKANQKEKEDELITIQLSSISIGAQILLLLGSTFIIIFNCKCA